MWYLYQMVPGKQGLMYYSRLTTYKPLDSKIPQIKKATTINSFSSKNTPSEHTGESLILVELS